MLKGLVSDFFNIIYPPLCEACRTVLIKQEQHLCTACLYRLPKTNFHLHCNNPMEQLFWGRVNIEAAAALYYFEQGGKCRKILHKIKYRGKKEIAMFLGTIYGKEILIAGRFSRPDLLIPVPLHPSREKRRGFNQSEWFAKGLAGSLGKKVYTDVLIRPAGTETQTNKSRIERWQNVENNFKLSRHDLIENKHILLVDDVVTTGATLESCASLLMRSEGVRVSILTIAYA